MKEVEVTFLPTWYDEYIEEGVRDIVKFLRENGINTYCSCHHSMQIQCDTVLDGAMQHLHNILYAYFSGREEPISYELVFRHRVENGYIVQTFIEITLLGRDKRGPDSHREQPDYTVRERASAQGSQANDYGCRRSNSIPTSACGSYLRQNFSVGAGP